MNKVKFKIGEFSKLNQVTVKTLRHYEEVGLLLPAEIDEWTGYRYYEVCQFQRMSRILYLKKLRFSLEEIKDLFDSGTMQPPLSVLNEKIEQCREEQALLHRQELELKRLTEKLQTESKMEEVFIKPLPIHLAASFRKVIKGYGELFHLCPNVIAPEMQRLGCVCAKPEYCYTIDHNDEYSETDVDIEVCEAVESDGGKSDLIQFKEVPAVETAACLYHHGSYDTFRESFSRLFSYVEENGYKITEHPRFSYIDGIWNKESEEEWLTEIQLPVTKV